MSWSDFVRRLRGASAPVAGARTKVAPPSGDETVTRWQKALADFQFPYTLVASTQAEAALDAERRAGLQEGFCPVIVVPGYWNSTDETAAARITRMRKAPLDRFDAAFGKDFLAKQFAVLYEDLALDPECLDPKVFDTLKPVAPRSRPPNLQSLQRYNRDAQAMEPLPEVAMMRIPTADAHTILAYLDWGGWNAVPSSLELVAVCRHWGERYGALLAAVGSDTLEFTVARRPATHADAVALLKEQYCFAPDNWAGDWSGLEEAAAELQASDTWFFWWD